jgi:hypothetical protein
VTAKNHCQKSLPKITAKNHCQKSLPKITAKTHCQNSLPKLTVPAGSHVTVAPAREREATPLILMMSIRTIKA